VWQLCTRMSDWLTVILLGIIEGITEFLPISSTGHLLVAQRWLQPQSDLFNIVIQGGTVLAVVLVFSTRVKQLVLRWKEPEARDYLAKLAVAFGITSVGGLALKALDFELPETVAPVAWALLAGGILMLGVEYWLKGKPLKAEISWQIAVAIGLAQLLAAIFPGASRSGSTILIALAMGLQRPLATEFTFLLGVPTLLAAGLVQIVTADDVGGAGEDWGMVLLASAVGALTAFISVKWLLKYVQTHTFNLFGWYRVGLGLLLLLLFL